MPERPDLAWVIPKLRDLVVGSEITAVEVRLPVLLRLGVPGTPEELLVGRRIVDVRRHLHFVVFDLEPADVGLAVHPMLAGRFRVDPVGGKGKRALGFVWVLDGERELRYADDKRMGKIYVMPGDGMDAIPGFQPVGVDVLDPAQFTVPALAKLLKKRRDQVKLFLLDKGVVDSFGNAYADEALHAARIHPKRRCSELSAEEVERLHGAMVRTLADATAEVARREPALDEKIRDFLAVRNRKGEPCPVCGTKVRAAGVRGHDAFFCPTCQPDSAGRGFVDWRKTRG